MQFKSYADAKGTFDSLSAFKESLKVRQLGPDDSGKICTNTFIFVIPLITTVLVVRGSFTNTFRTFNNTTLLCSFEILVSFVAVSH